MLDVSEQNLLTEIKASEDSRDKQLEAMKDQVRRYHGGHWRAGSNEQDFYPENHAYEYISLVVPRIVLNNPRVRVSTRRPGSQQLVAEAMRHGMNRWVRDNHLQRLLVRTAVDTMFNYGVLMTTQVPRPGRRPGETSFWPKGYRIPQKMQFRDYLAKHTSEARYAGHKWRRDKDDLLKRAKDYPDEKWNVAAIQSTTTDNDLTRDRVEGERLQANNPRNEIAGYEVWVPEYELPESPGRSEGFHGTIFTLAAQAPARMRREEYGAEALDRSAFIREPRPYYGPPWGPYTYFGIYIVPDSAYPLSPLTAVHGQQDDLNQHVISAGNADGQYKRLVLVNNSDPKLVSRVKSAEDSYVIPVQGLDKSRVVQVELGGSTPQMWEMIAQKRDRLDRNSGIFDAQRGLVAGRGTATEVAVADEASASRLGFIKSQFQDATQQFLTSVAWYLYHDDRVMFPLGTEAGEEMQMEEPWFQGGDDEEGSGATFEDLELEIEPYSMERTSEGLQQKRTMEVTGLLMELGQLAPMTPFINWKEVLGWVGDSHNFPDLKDVLDEELLAKVAGTEGPSFASQPEPRMRRDAGRAGAYGRAEPGNGPSTTGTAFKAATNGIATQTSMPWK